MTISFETVSVVLLIILNLIALYAIIKNTGAKSMETKKEIDELKKTVTILEQKVAVSESCNNKNDKAIAVIQSDVEWIKQGIARIEGALSKESK
jgi:hypothetical protein